MDQFQAKVLKFMKTQTEELDTTKKNIKKDLAQQERNVDEKLKAYKILSEESIKSLRDVTTVTLEDLSSIVLKCDQKVAKCDTAEDIVKMVTNIYDDPIARIQQSIKDLDKSFEGKISRIYKEDLWETGLIGNQGEEFPTLKAYLFSNLTQIGKSAQDF